MFHNNRRRIFGTKIEFDRIERFERDSRIDRLFPDANDDRSSDFGRTLGESELAFHRVRFRRESIRFCGRRRCHSSFIERFSKGWYLRDFRFAK